MAALTTILRLSQALVVALLVALSSSRGGAGRVAFHAGQIAAAQAALSSAQTTTTRAWSVNRPPSLNDLAVSELDLEDDEEGDEEASPAYVRPSVRVELRSRSKEVARSRSAAPLPVVVSHWMLVAHPRGPPAARPG